MQLLTPDAGFVDIAGDMLLGDSPHQYGTSTPLIGSGRSWEATARWVNYMGVYRSNPWLRAAVDLIGRGMSRLVLKVEVPDPETGMTRTVVPAQSSDAGRLAAALTRPLTGVSTAATITGTVTDRLVLGGALWEILGGPSRFQGFQRHPWSTVTVKSVGGVLAYHIRTGGNDRVLAETDVVHFGFWADPESPVASSPVASLRNTLALFDAVQRHLVGYFANSTRPAGTWKIDANTNPDTYEKIIGVIRDAYTGPDNAGRPIVTTGEYQALTQSPQHTEVVALSKLSREEIVAAFGVQPPSVGILDKAIQANAREAATSLARDTVGPHAEALIADLNAQVVSKRPRLELAKVRVVIDFEASLRPDVETFTAMTPNRLRVQTVNELRAERGLAPLDDTRADEAWFPNDPGAMGPDIAPQKTPSTPPEAKP